MARRTRLIEALLAALALVGASSPARADHLSQWAWLFSADHPHDASWQDLKYGAERGQTMGFLPSHPAARAPLFVELPSDGWRTPDDNVFLSDLPGFVVNHGYAYLAVGSRHRRTADDMLGDAAAAVAKLIAMRPRGVEAGGVVLFGHGAGGALALRLATEPRWLEAAGVPFAALSAAVILNGDGLLPGASPLPDRSRLLTPDEPSRPAEFDAPLDAAPPNARHVLLLLAGAPERSRRQADEVSAELTASGASVQVVILPTPVKSRSRDYLGDRWSEGSKRLAEFLASLG